MAKRIAFDWLPQMLALSPDGRSLYVSRYGSQALLGERFNPGEVEWSARAALATIDTSTVEVTSVISIENTYAPAGRIDLLETDRKGNVYFYTRRDAVSVMDPNTGQITQTFDLVTGRHGPVGVHPTDAAFLSDGSQAYIACGDSYLLAIVDTQSSRPVGWIKLGLEPVAVVVTPDDRFAYVSNRRSEEISVIDLAAKKVVVSIPVRRWTVYLPFVNK